MPIDAAKIFDRRRAGILLHPTSLPGPWENGDLGVEAYRFVDFLAAAGQTVWQLLPLGPTHANGSPYQCLSVHAGNPRLISLDALVEKGWLERVQIERARTGKGAGTDGLRERLLEEARRGFAKRADETERAAYEGFVAAHRDWLADYALFQVLRQEHDRTDWSQWPAPLRDRDGQALAEARRRHQATIELVQFEQFVFYSQWTELKDYANRRGVLLFGDLPIFVAHDSVDVWAGRELFELDERGCPTVVAGVPPDYFSETGQRWGNPHYRWQHMERDGFAWWMRRIESQFALFDLMRIDHFRGFEAYWEIPADHPTAIGGRWVRGPGEKFFDVMLQRFGSLPFVAEDLGVITPEVTSLRDKYHLPGMLILQFAFDGSRANPYLPHNHHRDYIVYTGTHDNDTALGWYANLNERQRAYVLDYLGQPGEPMPWPLIRAALRSIANTAIIPIQDVLGLGSEHRMNTPGTTGPDNWRWRFDWQQLPPGLDARLRQMTELYGRI